MSSTLVTTATGTVGRHVLRALYADGAAARAATRSPARYDGPGQPVALDFADPSTFTAALDGVDRVFLLEPTGHVDALGLLGEFIAAIGRSGVQKVVTMTAQGVEHDDAIPLRQVELAVEKTGVRAIHLRPTWFSQNFATYWRAGIVQADVIAVPAGDTRTAFVDAADIGAAAAAALRREDVDGAFELTGPDAMTYAEAAAVVSELAGRPIRYVPVSDDDFRAACVGGGLPADYADMLVALFQTVVRGGVAARVTDDVRKLTGRPPTPLRDALADVASAFRSESGGGTGRV